MAEEGRSAALTAAAEVMAEQRRSSTPTAAAMAEEGRSTTPTAAADMSGRLALLRARRDSFQSGPSPLEQVRVANAGLQRAKELGDDAKTKGQIDQLARKWTRYIAMRREAAGGDIEPFSQPTVELVREFVSHCFLMAKKVSRFACPPSVEKPFSLPGADTFDLTHATANPAVRAACTRSPCRPSTQRPCSGRGSARSRCSALERSC